MKKRLIRLLLAAALLLALLPASAFSVFAAKTTVNELNMDFVLFPRVGSQAGNYFVALEEDVLYYGGWYNDTDGCDMLDDDIFEAGKYYSYGMTIYTEDDGYVISPSVRFYVDGLDSLVDTDYSYYDGEVAYLWSIPVEAIEKPAVTSLHAVGFSAPTAGTKAGSFAPTITEAVVPSGGWYCDTDDFYLEDDDVFVAGKEYSYCVFFFAEGVDYYISPSVRFYVNGGTASVDTDNSVTDGMFVNFWTKPVTAVAAGSLKGDTTLDDIVTSSDLTALAKHVGGVSSLTAAQAVSNADMNNDGTVDATDLTKLARVVGGIE